MLFLRLIHGFVYEMAGNAIKGEFRTAKMSAGGHFVKNLKKESFVSI